MRNAVILLACLLGVVVIAGCGGGGGGNGGALSKEDYEEAMQALQADLEASSDELQQAFSDPQDIPAMSDGPQPGGRHHVDDVAELSTRSSRPRTSPTRIR